MRWTQSRRTTIVAWLRILLLKAIGPLDRARLQSTIDYLVFWIGEKSQALGFLWGLVRLPFMRHMGNP
jgi:hypothetical protein